MQEASLSVVAGVSILPSAGKPTGHRASENVKPSYSENLSEEALQDSEGSPPRFLPSRKREKKAER